MAVVVVVAVVIAVVPIQLCRRRKWTRSQPHQALCRQMHDQPKSNRTLGHCFVIVRRMALLLLLLSEASILRLQTDRPSSYGFVPVGGQEEKRSVLLIPSLAVSLSLALCCCRQADTECTPSECINSSAHKLVS